MLLNVTFYEFCISYSHSDYYIVNNICVWICICVIISKQCSRILLTCIKFVLQTVKQWKVCISKHKINENPIQINHILVEKNRWLCRFFRFLMFTLYLYLVSHSSSFKNINFQQWKWKYVEQKSETRDFWCIRHSNNRKIVYYKIYIFEWCLHFNSFALVNFVRLFRVFFFTLLLSLSLVRHIEILSNYKLSYCIIECSSLQRIISQTKRIIEFGEFNIH